MTITAMRPEAVAGGNTPAAPAPDIDFDSIVREHRARLVRIIYYTQIVSWADAEDAVQGAIVEAWANRDRFRGGDNHSTFVSWILAMARTGAVNAWRDRCRDSSLDEWHEDFGFEFEDCPAQSNDLPCVAEPETMERVNAALERLTPDQRIVVEMRCLRGMTPEQVATQLGRSRQAVSTLLSSALTQTDWSGPVWQNKQRARALESPQAQLIRARPYVLGALTPRQRQVVRMHYIDEMTVSAIGERLGLARKVVSEIVRRSLRRLDVFIASPAVAS